MQDKGIIRNRLKVQSIIKNARAYLALEAQGIDFADYLWGFVGGAHTHTLLVVSAMAVAAILGLIAGRRGRLDDACGRPLQGRVRRGHSSAA